MTPRSLAHRAPLLGLVVAWGLGSAWAHAGQPLPSQAGLAVIAVAGLLLAWSGRLFPPRFQSDSLRRVALGLALALAASGALRTTQERARLADWDTLELPPREARLQLRVERVFATVEAGRAGGIARVTGAAPHLRDLTGQRIQFFATWPGGDAPAALRGVEFAGTGLLQRLPFSPAGGDFDRFLADQGVNFTFNRVRLDGPPRPAGALTRFYAAAGTRMEAVLRTGLADNPAAADLYVAMLLGKKEHISDQQKDWFIRSGTMHLFAISGLHIAGIAAAFTALLTLARLPGWARFVCGTIALWVYVEITGGAASAVRAWWMVTCLHAAYQFRLPGNSLAALSASALSALVVSPHELFSAGFQMSYGTVVAILLYGVPLQERWLAAWQPWANLPPEMRGRWHAAIEFTGRYGLAALALGLSATLVSTPASLGFFGLISPGGFFVNLLLIPASSLVLFSGVAALLVGSLGFTAGADVFNHAAALVLTAMQSVVEWSLRLPVTSWPAEFAFPWLAAWSGALMLALLAFGYATGWSRRFGGYWTPYAALALLLLLGSRSLT